MYPSFFEKILPKICTLLFIEILLLQTFGVLAEDASFTAVRLSYPCIGRVVLPLHHRTGLELEQKEL